MPFSPCWTHPETDRCADAVIVVAQPAAAIGPFARGIGSVLASICGAVGVGSINAAYPFPHVARHVEGAHPRSASRMAAHVSRFLIVHVAVIGEIIRDQCVAPWIDQIVRAACRVFPFRLGKQACRTLYAKIAGIKPGEVLTRAVRPLVNT